MERGYSVAGGEDNIDTHVATSQSTYYSQAFCFL